MDPHTPNPTYFQGHIFSTSNRPPAYDEYRASPAPSYGRRPDDASRYGDSQSMAEQPISNRMPQTPQRLDSLPTPGSSSMNIRNTPAPPPKVSLFSTSLVSTSTAAKSHKPEENDSNFFSPEIQFDSGISSSNIGKSSTSSNLNYNPSMDRSMEYNDNMQNEATILDRWVTVFGFPLSYTSAVLTYFHNLGQIQRVKHAPNQGNWIHILYKTKLQADKAIGRNGKILESGTIMIGVIPCRDPSVIDEQVEGVPIHEKETAPSMLADYSVVPPESQPTPQTSIWSKLMEAVVGI